MSKMALFHVSPLYGRRTRNILLEVLSFSDARKRLDMLFEDILGKANKFSLFLSLLNLFPALFTVLYLGSNNGVSGKGLLFPQVP